MMADLTDPTEAQAQQPPSFDEWVRFCFTQGYDDWSGYSDDDGFIERQARFLSLEPERVARYLTRLFESPAFLADQYNDDQIAKATKFVFGPSEYLKQVRFSPINPDLQSRCIRSVATLYTDLFDRVCRRSGTDLDSDIGSSEVNSAVYMIWDMDGIVGAVMFPEKGPHLRQAGIEVLQRVLTRCRTSTCLISALHGIGHIYRSSRHKGDLDLCQRLEEMIDAFLASRELPEWVREYAASARDGAVQ